MGAAFPDEQAFWGTHTDEEGNPPVQSDVKTKRARARRSGGIIKVLLACATVIAVFLLVEVGLGIYMASVVAQARDVRIDPTAMQRTTIVYAADGSVLARWHGEQDRTLVRSDQIPDFLRDAVVAAEDQRFYEHHGIDAQGIARALAADAGSGEIRQGGSTITQQLVKRLYTDGKRTFGRKIKEAIIANALEQHVDKSTVLALYLNTVYFGQGCYGVEAASQHYFGVRTSELTPSQAATLAGLIKSPNRLNPIDNLPAATERRNFVVQQMVRQGYMSPERALDAEQDPPFTVAQKAPDARAAYFVEYVKQTLLDRFGSDMVYRGGLRVYTTLDPALQDLATRAASRLSAPGDPEVALVSIRRADGAIVAMYGGRDYNRNQFNLAVLGRRQPGSSFKPFVLATALEQGIKPSDRFSAAPYSVRVKDGVWNVQNYENQIKGGQLPLTTATDLSVNAVFARLIMRVGAENVVSTAKRMGITTALQPDPAIALGGLRTGVSPLEMASSYGTIANGGMAVAPTAIDHVLDGSGKVLLSAQPKPRRAISRVTAHIESGMLHNVIAKGTGKRADIGRWAAGKTGTTQSYRDAWFVGYSGEIVTSVWVGHRAGQVPMTNVHGIRVTGGTFPAEIWAAFMRPAVVMAGKSVRHAEVSQ